MEEGSNTTTPPQHKTPPASAEYLQPYLAEVLLTEVLGLELKLSKVGRFSPAAGVAGEEIKHGFN